ncbi:MAG: nucleotidyltransferase [Anaerolineales bacterium]|nr:nucleotidyltransferase [Anaerolineales bacterium]
MFNNPNSMQSVIDFLNEHNIPYMLIGGLAISIWGEMRVTHDVDFKVSVDMPLADFRKLVLERFPARPTNIPPHKLSPHVIHIWASPDVAADILVSIFDYEREAIKRAVHTEVLGVPTRVCTAEDFIIHKVTANRDKDWLDVESILIRQRGKLDVQYIRNWLTQFAEALENPEMLAHFEKLYKEANS